MASHAAALLAISLLILWTSHAQSGTNDAEDCCLFVSKRPIPANRVQSFRYILLQHGCQVPAVVFTTLRGHQLCAPPEMPWVQRLVLRLKRNAAKSKLS
ncbi:C-C motif chemokine 19 [Artibeus jamaicensis]|uniref:C-C motif chemokine 19 n=1 Tax=Artibeus jamaicensis TaxID=9417 RepID=UPI00187CF305|nr:C-C motif chemokine 19 [Artibeus jamaicensis]